MSDIWNMKKKEKIFASLIKKIEYEDRLNNTTDDDEVILLRRELGIEEAKDNGS